MQNIPIKLPEKPVDNSTENQQREDIRARNRLFEHKYQFSQSAVANFYRCN